MDVRDQPYRQGGFTEPTRFASKLAVGSVVAVVVGVLLGGIFELLAIAGVIGLAVAALYGLGWITGQR